MPPRPLALAVALLLCACAGPSVRLDRYRGVYTTHFDGLPDSSRVCALLTHRGGAPVDWIRLRLRAFSPDDQSPSRATSLWIYEGSLAPGESVSVELANPPVAPEIELTLAGAGSGHAPRGRPLVRTPDCTRASLVAAARGSLLGRTAPGIRVQSVIRRGELGKH